MTKLQQWLDAMDKLDREATEGEWVWTLDYCLSHIGSDGEECILYPRNAIDPFELEPGKQRWRGALGALGPHAEENSYQNAQMLSRSRTELPRAVKIIREYRKELRKFFVRYVEDIGTGLEDTKKVADRWLSECDAEIEKILGEGEWHKQI